MAGARESRGTGLDGTTFDIIGSLTGEWRVYLLLAITLLGLGPRLYRIDAFGWWDGEPYTILHSLHPLTELPRVLRDFAAHPPLWYVVTHLSLYLGSNETLLRFPALAVGVLSIPVTYLLGEHLFGKAEGLLAAFLLAISPVAIRWSQSVRMYSAMLFLSILSLYFLWRALEEGRIGLWAGFVVSTVLNLYNHYFSLFVLLDEALFVGLLTLAGLWTSRGGSRRVQSSQEPAAHRGLSFQPTTSATVRKGVAFLGSLSVVFILYLPWIPIMRGNFFSRQAGFEREAAQSISLISPSFLSALFGDFSGAYGSALILFGALFMIGLLSLLMRYRRKQLLLSLLWIGLPLLIVAPIAPRRFHAKYFLFMLPIYLLLLSQGIVALGRGVKREVEGVHSRRLGGLLGASTTITCLVALSALNLGLLRLYFLGESTPFEAGTEPYQFRCRADWRELLTHLEEYAQPGDFVLVRSEKDYPVRKSFLLYLGLNDNLRSKFSDHALSSGGYVNVWWIGMSRALEKFKPPPNYEIISPLLRWGTLGMVRTQTQVQFKSPQDINPGFEKDDGTDYGKGDRKEGNGIPDGWIVVQGRDRISLDGLTALEGKRSLAIANTEGDGVVMISPPFAVQPRKPVRLSAWVKGGVMGYYKFWPSFELLFFNVSDEQVKSSRSTGLSFEGPSLEGWRSIAVGAITPRKAAYARVSIASGPYLGAYSPCTWIDDLQLQVGEGY